MGQSRSAGIPWWGWILGAFAGCVVLPLVSLVALASIGAQANRQQYGVSTRPTPLNTPPMGSRSLFATIILDTNYGEPKGIGLLRNESGVALHNVRMTAYDNEPNAENDMKPGYIHVIAQSGGPRVDVQPGNCLNLSMDGGPYWASLHDIHIVSDEGPVAFTFLRGFPRTFTVEGSAPTAPHPAESGPSTPTFKPFR